MWECVCVRSVASTATIVRMTLDLGVGLPGIELFKILHKVTPILVSSFISKYQIRRLLYLLSVSQCLFSPESSSLRQNSWLSHLGVRNKKQGPGTAEAAVTGNLELVFRWGASFSRVLPQRMKGGHCRLPHVLSSSDAEKLILSLDFAIPYIQTFPPNNRKEHPSTLKKKIGKHHSFQFVLHIAPLKLT